MKNKASKFKVALRKARLVRKKHNKSLISQALDLKALYSVNPTCNIWDYYKHRLYCMDRKSSIYRELLGFSVSEALSRSLNPRSGVTPSWNKLIFATLCKTYHIPTAELLGVFMPNGPIPDYVTAKMHNVKDIHDFMLFCKSPFFVKPVQCKQGLGAYCVSGIDSSTDIVTTSDNRQFSFDEFIKATVNQTDNPHYHRKLGYLFQEVASQHPELTSFTGNAVPSGFRVVVLNDEKLPRVHRAIWKVTAPGNISDNFSEGKLGNIVVSVNPETGALSDAVDGYWPSANYHTSHPVTGKVFKDFSIPLWDEMISTLIRASSAINTMNILHWDVILGPDGPVILELNDIGGTEFLQLHEQGLMDNSLRDFLRKNGNLTVNKKLRDFVNAKEVINSVSYG